MAFDSIFFPKLTHFPESAQILLYIFGLGVVCRGNILCTVRFILNNVRIITKYVEYSLLIMSVAIEFSVVMDWTSISTNLTDDPRHVRI